MSNVTVSNSHKITILEEAGKYADGKYPQTNPHAVMLNRICCVSYSDGAEVEANKAAGLYDQLAEKDAEIIRLKEQLNKVDKGLTEYNSREAIAFVVHQGMEPEEARQKYFEFKTSQFKKA